MRPFLVVMRKCGTDAVVKKWEEASRVEQAGEKEDKPPTDGGNNDLLWWKGRSYAGKLLDKYLTNARCRRVVRRFTH